MNDEILERLQQIEKLKDEFTSILRVESMRQCPQCREGIVNERDRVESGGSSGVWVTTLYYCPRCGYYNIGDIHWTSDY